MILVIVVELDTTVNKGLVQVVERSQPTSQPARVVFVQAVNAVSLFTQTDYISVHSVSVTMVTQNREHCNQKVWRIDNQHDTRGEHI